MSIDAMYQLTVVILYFRLCAGLLNLISDTEEC